MHKHFSVWVVAAVAILLIAVLIVPPARADDTPSWATSSQLYISKVADISSEQIPPSAFASGNVDCSYVYETNCAVDTPYGQVFNSSLRVSDRWIPIKDYGDNGSNFIPIPGSDTAITFSNSPIEGVNLYFNSNVSDSLVPKYVLRPGQTNVNVIDNLLLDSFRLSVPYERALADKSGHALPADLNSMSFSGNGQWMVVTDPDIATMRVNINNGAVLPFATGFSYGLGQNPVPKTAVTSDGRYAVLASLDTAAFAIYDLSTCTDPADHITTYTNCQSIDLMNIGFIQQHIPGFSGVQYVRFIDDSTINLYAKRSENGTTKFAQYVLSLDGAPGAKVDYLALGDSYISGEGAYDYLSGTDTADNTCHVSLFSYPLLLGKELSYDSYHSVACSGATTLDLVRSDDGYTGQVKNGANRSELNKSGRVKSILTNFQQGYISQLDFVKQYQPKTITLSIGGNDIGFSARLRGCLNTGTCYKTYEDRLEFVKEVNDTFPKLVKTYSQIKNAGAADAKIYVIGYPQIAKADGDCAENVQMNKDELVFAEQAINYLDTAVKYAAAKAGVFYVDTQDTFYDHRLCEAGPGSIAMNGITGGNDFPDKLNGPIGRESYHPNAYGHQLLEARILSATIRLTAPMPAADLSSSIPDNASREFLNAPHSNREVKKTIYDDSLADDLVYKDVPTIINIDGPNNSLAIGTQLKAELHSVPIPLGNYVVGTNGIINSKLTIPSSVEPGYHSLHFYGSNVANQKVDIYKIVYVADKTNAQPQSIAEGTSSGDGSVSTFTLAGETSTLPSKTNVLRFNEQSETKPKVLSDSVQSAENSVQESGDNLRLAGSDFIKAGLAIFVLSSLVYAVKLSIFSSSTSHRKLGQVPISRTTKPRPASARRSSLPV